MTCKKVLVVDDEADIQRLFMAKFRQEIDDGLLELSFADNGEQAISLCGRLKDYDLIISDVIMPVMDGFKLLEAVKESCPQIPVIMVTAYSDDDSRVRAESLGAVEFMIKPINFDLLKEKAFEYLA